MIWKRSQIIYLRMLCFILRNRLRNAILYVGVWIEGVDLSLSSPLWCPGEDPSSFPLPMCGGLSRQRYLLVADAVRENERM